MKRDIIRILYICLFLVFAFTIKTYAESDFDYTISGGNATITAYHGNDSNVVIPGTIDGYQVRAIRTHAFDESRNNTNGHGIVNLTISEGIRYMGDYAFAGCINIETVQLPNSIMDIGNYAFLGCEKLHQINIPSSLYDFGIEGGYSFQETNFTEFTIPENINNIGNRTFRLCRNLRKVYIYNDNIAYYDLSDNDLLPFELCSSDLVLYGNEGSTTQAYAQSHGMHFELIGSEPSNIPVESISLNKTSMQLEIGQNEILFVTINPNNATNKTVTWTSSNPSVASVQNGNVIAVSQGTATITVTNSDGTKRAQCTVTVANKSQEQPPTDDEILITSITLKKSQLTLQVGDEETLYPIITPDNATDKTLIWKSNDEDIVSVENGKIVAKKEGFTIITVTNNVSKVTAVCSVTVTKKNETQNKDQDKTSDTSGTKTGQEDRTVSTGTLPQTGVNSALLIGIIGLIVIACIYHKKYSNLKSI